jgi:hypothetical protein
VRHVEQELITLQERLTLTPFLCGSCCSIFSFMCSFVSTIFKSYGSTATLSHWKGFITQCQVVEQKLCHIMEVHQKYQRQ